MSGFAILADVPVMTFSVGTESHDFRSHGLLLDGRASRRCIVSTTSRRFRIRCFGMESILESATRAFDENIGRPLDVL